MASWKSVRLAQDDLPHLLVKARLDSSGYAIHLTDLSRVWSETLTKREIERRAIKEDCSIDPGEDAQQYSILLEKLRSTLNQKDDTNLVLKPGQKDDDVLLELSSPLPHPLQPLKWTVRLAAQPQDHIATEVVHPLIRLAEHQQIQIQHLIHELGEKDRIIAKLTDRLETSGNDLTTVFPGVSNVKLSRKKTQREQLARHVRGLGDFDEAEWRERAKNLREGGTAAVDPTAMEVVLRDLPEPVTDSSSEHIQDWWKQLDDKPAVRASNTNHISKTNRTEKQGNVRPHPAPAEEDQELTTSAGESFDAEFQRQGTPPYLKRGQSRPTADSDRQSKSTPTPQPAAVAPEDESTEDESDLDAPAKETKSTQPARKSMPTRQRSVTPEIPPAKPHAAEQHKRTSSPTPEVASPNQQPAKLRSRLGAIGGKSRTSATPSPAPAPEHEAEPEAMEVDTAPAPSKPLSKLGKIGGKFKAQTPPLEEPATTTATASPAKRHGLGTIGGKKAKQNTTNHEPARRGSETPSVAASITTQGSTTERKPRANERREVKELTPPRETSQERADRKRNELKRQLDEKAKVPVKKKRKF